jgi:peptidoglycan-associated lipoprotein
MAFRNVTRPSQRLLLTSAALILPVVLPGCASTQVATTAEEKSSKEERVVDPLARLPVAPPPPTPAPPPPAAVQSAPQEAAAPPAVFLFDIPFQFDRYTLRPESRNMVEVNANRLREKHGSRLLLEGRTDEIGSVDYNLVLGERRARAVQDYLIDLGIPPSSMEIVSYGKEKPLCLEHTVPCWAENRSVHFAVK